METLLSQFLHEAEQCGHWACNGQFGEGTVQPKTLLLASPLSKDNPGSLVPELLHFPLMLFPTAGSFSTPFKALSPTPCFGVEHRGGHRAMRVHGCPSARSGDAVPGRLLLYLAWLARPAHSTVCTQPRGEGTETTYRSAKPNTGRSNAAARLLGDDTRTRGESTCLPVWEHLAEPHTNTAAPRQTPGSSTGCLPPRDEDFRWWGG